MCDPSKSWSVMNITLPYRSRLAASSAVYSRPFSSPRMRLISAISVFSAMRLIASPRTFMNLPFTGYTPIVLRSSLLRPDTMPALAESPSQKMIVHCADFSVPAKLASMSFGMPRMVRVLAPSVFFAAFASLTSVKAQAASITPIFATFSTNSSLTVQADPKFALVVVSSSFVWLENAGFSTSQRKKSVSCSLIVAGFTSTFFLVLMNAANLRSSWPMMYSTCLPPLDVQMPFTNDTCANSSVLVRHTAYSQRSLGASYTRFTSGRM